MRSTTFDMVGMTLMAIVAILTTHGMLTWAYLKEQRGGQPQDPAPDAAGSERTESRSAHRASTLTEPVAEDAEAPQAARVGERRVLAGHR